MRQAFFESSPLFSRVGELKRGPVWMDEPGTNSIRSSTGPDLRRPLELVPQRCRRIIRLPCLTANRRHKSGSPIRILLLIVGRSPRQGMTRVCRTTGSLPSVRTVRTHPTQPFDTEAHTKFLYKLKS